MRGLAMTAAMMAWSVLQVQAASWETTVAAGMNLTAGNSDSLVANAGVNAVRTKAKHEVRMLAECNYGENRVDGDEQKTVDNAKGGLEYKFSLNGHYLYTNNSLFRDLVAGLDYRLIIGGGGGYHVIHSDAAKLEVELGLAYIREELSNADRDESVALRAAARHEQKLSEAAQLWAQIEYLPQTDDFAIYLINSEVGVEASLVRDTSLNLRTVVQHRYVSDVPAESEHGDLSVISALVYKL